MAFRSVKVWCLPLALRLPPLNTAHTVYHPLCGAAPAHIHPASPGACLLVPVYLRHSSGHARAMEAWRGGEEEEERGREGGREERGRRGEVHVFG